LDKKTLTEKLKEITNPDGPQYKGALEKKLSLPEGLQDSIFSYTLGQLLLPVLEDQSEFFGLNRMLCLENGSTSFSPRFLSQELIKQCLERRSAERAVEWLEKVSKTTEAEGMTVSVYWGMKCEEKIEFTDDIALVPLDQLPSSGYLDNLNKPIIPDTHPLSILSRFLYEKPTVSLTFRTNIKPLFISTGEERDNSYETLASQTLNDIALVLTVCGPSVPIMAVSWFQFLDRDIEAAINFPEVIPNRI